MMHVLRMAGYTFFVFMLVGGSRSWAETEKTVHSREPQVQQFEEVERGFWIKSFFGISVTSQNPFRDKSRKNPVWPPGGTIGVEMGVDFGQVGSIHMAACGLHLTGNRIVDDNTSNVANDVGVFMLMAGGRFNVATTKRTAWYLKGAAGYLMARPKEATLEDGLVLQMGAGIEYATNLRHFYVGLELGAGYFLASKGLISIITPVLKYTF